MSRIVFARTRWHYDSYVDYWKLVELSKFPTCYVDEIDQDSGDVYIVSPMNGEWLEFSKSIRHGCGSMFVMWNLERPSGSGGLDAYAHDNKSLLKVNGGKFDDIIVSDRQLARDSGLMYVPLGSHPGLGTLSFDYVKRYDTIHLSCMSDRRWWLFDRPDSPKKLLGRFTVAPNGWGEDRHNSLLMSKSMLCVHQDNSKYIEPLRYALAIAYGLPIVTETVHDPYPYDGPGLYVWSDTSDALHVLDGVLNDYVNVIAKVYVMYHKIMGQYMFRDNVESWVLLNFPNFEFEGV